MELIQIIKKMKKKFLSRRIYIGIILFFLLAVVIYLLCGVKYPNYYFLSPDNKYIYQIERNEESVRMIKDKGIIIYVEFYHLTNDSYAIPIIDIFTENKYNRIYIHDFEFFYKDQRKAVKINKVYDLSQEQYGFKVDGFEEIYGYLTYIGSKKSDIKIYYSRIFDKSFVNIGDVFPVQLKISYSLDNDANIETKIITYNVSAKPHIKQVAPSWMFHIFKGM